MTVIITGMILPKSCLKCPMLNGMTTCPFGGNVTWHDRRHPDCPIRCEVERFTHGRNSNPVVDACLLGRELYERVWDYTCVGMCSIYNTYLDFWAVRGVTSAFAFPSK